MFRVSSAAVVVIWLAVYAGQGCLSRGNLVSDKVDNEQLCLKALEDDDSVLLRRLIATGFDVNQILFPVGCEMSNCHKKMTVLMLACQVGAVECIEQLDRAGVDYGCSMPDGRNVLHYASYLTPELAIAIAGKALSTGNAGLDDKDYLGWTPLLRAIDRGNCVFAEWMIKRGASVGRWIEMTPGLRKSYLSVAATAPYPIFEYFLDEVYSAALDNVEPKELLLSINLGADDYGPRIKKVLSKGACLNDLYVGRRVLNNLLRQCPHLTVEKLQLLVDFGLPYSCIEDCLSRAENNQKTVICSFLRGRNCQTKEDLTSVNSGSKTSMCLAQCIFSRDNVDALTCALNNGLQVNECFSPTSALGDGLPLRLQEQWHTPFTLACTYNATNCIRRLMLEGVQYGIALPDKRNIMHYLSKMELSIAKEIASEVLLSDGANVDTVDIYGATPLWYALKAGNVALAKWLVERGAQLCRWKIIGPCKRELYLAAAMRFPYESFEFMIDEFEVSSNGNISLGDLYLCLDLHGDDCLQRITKLKDSGAAIDVNIGYQILQNLFRDLSVNGDEAEMNSSISGTLSMLVNNGLPIECVESFANCSSGAQRKILVSILERQLTHE